MSSSVKDILSKTNQQFGLLDDDRKIAYAQDEWLERMENGLYGQAKSK